MAEFIFRYGDGTMNFEYPEENHLIVVSDIDPEIFKKSKIHGVHTIDEAIKLAHELTGKEHMSTCIMPYEANRCVYVSE